MDTERSTDEFDAALAAHLSGCAVGDSFRVEEVLKSSVHEVTQVVYFEGRSGDELGPFVRKRIAVASGLGGVYETLRASQRAGARHLHLPRVYACRSMGDTVDVLMEYVPGETLEQAVRRLGGSPATARALMPAVCDAASELHECFDPPIIHRDLKPSNIMLSANGAWGYTATVIDLGIARTWRPGAQADTTHFGTRSYAPPEQFGFGQTDERTDVYALGMLLFFCCTGENPPAALGTEQLEAHGVPTPLRAVIEHATAFDPEARCTSVRAFREELATALDGEPARAPRVEAATKTAASLLAAQLRSVFSTAGLRRILAGASRAAARVPRGLGRAWNMLLFAAFVFVVVGCVGGALSPTPDMARYPLVARALQYLFFLGIPAAVLAYLLADRRAIRERHPGLAAITTGQEWLLGIAVIVISLLLFVAVLVVCAIAGI